MAANPFTWVEIYVQDLERAKTFYEAVFDFKLEKLQTEIPMWAFPADPGKWGAGGALVKMEGVPSGGAAPWLTSAAATPTSKRAGQLLPAARSTPPRNRLANLASSPC